ncbi:MAG: DUF2339 domain-containing protein [Terracidiphilus sp.]|jgi:uncharacterized membrane protein
MNSEFSGSVENEVVELRNRVLRIEEALRRRGVVLDDSKPTSAAAQAAAPPPRVVPAAVAATTPVDAQALSPPPQAVQPMFASVGAPAKKDEQSLENRIGSQWFNRIGILALLIAAAWFLKFAVDNHWIGPLGRVLIGLVAGGGLIAWSERFRAKGYSVFSYSLKAVGSGVLYLSLWAAFSLFHLMPASAAFALMILVTAFNGLMAWVQDAELLALYAIVGGLSTPLLLSTGENHEVTLLSYLLLMAIAVLILVILRPWSRLLFASFTGTVLIVFGWWTQYYTESQFVRTGFFLLCFFLIFAFAPRLVQVKKEATEGVHGWDALALVLLPVANASLGFLGFYVLLDRASTHWAWPWLAVGFAAFYLLLLRLPAQGRLRASPAVLDSLHLAAAVVFLTLAIPLKAQGRWLTVGWLVEGAALLWVSSRVKSPLLRVLSMGCLILGLTVLLTVNPTASMTPVFNARFGTYCVAIAVFAFSAWVAMKARGQEEQKQSTSWPVIAIGASLLVNALILLAVSLEIDSFWRVRGSTSEWSPQFEQHRMFAQFSYSAWFMLFGAILLAVGFWRRSSFLRWQALVLLAVSVAKVFLVDMSELSQGYRILSFLGLGALLLAVSFVYQRDWLNLRGAKIAEEQEGPSA